MSESRFLTIEHIPPVIGGNTKDRSVYLLFCTAALMVCIMDAFWLGMPHWYGLLRPGEAGWIGGSVCRVLCGSPAMLFAMISGAVLLDPERRITIGDTGRKAAGLFIAYVFWCLLYALYRIHTMDPQPLLTGKLLLQQWLVQPEPLWYITIFMGLYILTPLLRYITAARDGKLLRYIVLVFAGAVLLRTAYGFWPDLPIGEDYIVPAIITSPMRQFCQYMFWMLFGWILYNYRPGPRMRLALYAIAILLVILAVCWDVQGHQYALDFQNPPNGRYTIATLAKNVALFYIITGAFREGPSVPYHEDEIYTPVYAKAGGSFLKTLSNSALTIYLSHWLFLLFLFDHGFLQNSGMAAWLMLLIYAAVSWICGVTLALMVLPIARGIKMGF